MIRKDCLAIVALTVFAFGCSSVPQQTPLAPEVVEVTLPASADRVKAAVTKVLADDNYDVDWNVWFYKNRLKLYNNLRVEKYRRLKSWTLN